MREPGNQVSEPGPVACAERLLRIPAEALPDAWPAIARHVEQLANPADLMRAVAEGRAALWCIWAGPEPASGAVIGLAIVGEQDGAVRIIAATLEFIRRAAHVQMAVFAEASRRGWLRVEIDMPADILKLSYDLAAQLGAFDVRGVVSAAPLGRA